MDVYNLLTDMASQLTETRDADSALEKVSQFARAATRADDAGIIINRSRTELEAILGTSSEVERAHVMQVELAEGPCLDAVTAHSTYVSGDIETDHRWPRWGPEAAQLGYHSVLSCALKGEKQRFGSLNVYSRTPHAFGHEDLSVIKLLAAVASTTLSGLDIELNLQAALQTRTVIGQAQGIIIASLNVDADTAFAFLKRRSQSENVPVRTLAERIVATGQLKS